VTQDNTTTNKTSLSRFPRWLVVLAILSLLAVCCLIGAVVLLRNSLTVKGGGYSIDQVVLTNALDANGHPVGSSDTFKPSEKIICWVSTSGVDGIVGMRWYYGDKLIGEQFAKTRNNSIYTFLQSSQSGTLEEGQYRVQIHLTPSSVPLKTIRFTVKKYAPNVVPPQPTPTNHQSIEKQPYTEIPFAFDEVWTIGETKWRVNEVKIVFLESGESFVEVVVDTDIKNPMELSEKQAKDVAKPVALYAVQHGYLERARSLQIDGKSYALNELLFVSLINGAAGNRAMFNLSELSGTK
jgi:hypothetical protein